MRFLKNFVYQKSTIWGTLNLIFLPLKFSSLKHLWDIMGVGKITNRIVREVIAKIVVKKKVEAKLAFSRTKKHALWQHQK